MNKVNQLVVAAAALAFTAAALPAQAGRLPQSASGPQLCNGQLFGGDYIVRQYPTLAPLTAEHFNIAAGEQLIASVESHGSFLRVVPADGGAPCEDVMRKLEDLNFVDTAEPNWIVGFGGPMMQP